MNSAKCTCACQEGMLFRLLYFFFGNLKLHRMALVQLEQHTVCGTIEAGDSCGSTRVIHERGSSPLLS